MVKAKKDGGDEEGKSKRRWRNQENSALSRKQEIKWHHGPFKIEMQGPHLLHLLCCSVLLDCGLNTTHSFYQEL